jgi:uncharacterized protein YbjT (DUF2867 family)
MKNAAVQSKVLISGATGYVGGRLVKRLEASDMKIRCIARRPSNLVSKVSADVEVVHGDVNEPITLDTALDGIDTAFYLVHSLAASGDLESMELAGARNFAQAAKRAKVKRIIYLGGLGDNGNSTSAHMRSRHAVGEALRYSGVPTLEFRASVIIGSGSLSFELIRSLVNRLPIMVVPKWVRVEAQPIAIDDVLDYLVQAIDVPMSGSTLYEIGGEDRLSYLDLMKLYGEAVSLRRIYLNVPFLTPWLSSLWLNLVTPLFARVGRKLIDSIRIPSIVSNNQALRDFQVRPMAAAEAIRRSLDEEDVAFRQTHWSDALSTTPSKNAYGGQIYRSRIIDSRSLTVECTAEEAFPFIERIGGDNGWYYADWLWMIRGVLDRICGGVGMQRGRRDPETLRTGDTLDCWRVERIEEPRTLLLRAEMKVFGRAWLHFEIETQDGRTLIRQTAIYDPHGFSGLIYWYTLYLLHELVFQGMLRGIGDAISAKKRHRNINKPVKVISSHEGLPSNSHSFDKEDPQVSISN